MNELMYAKTKETRNPERGTGLSAGLDFFIPSEWNDGNEFTINSGKNIVIPMGIHINLVSSGLENFMMMFENKSGVATKRGLLVGAKVIDADYQGELMVNIHNPSDSDQTIKPNDKIIQGILIPVQYSTPKMLDFNALYPEVSERGEGRFGSTGD